MADSDGRDETGSSSGRKKMKDSQLDDQNQLPAAIITISSDVEEEEEETEHQEAEQSLQETNRASAAASAGNVRRLYDCMTCGRQFESPHGVAAHQRAHMDKYKKAERQPADGGAKCEYCGRSFKNWHGLRIHEQKVHADDDNWQQLRGKESMGMFGSASTAEEDSPAEEGSPPTPAGDNEEEGEDIDLDRKLQGGRP